MWEPRTWTPRRRIVLTTRLLGTLGVVVLLAGCGTGPDGRRLDGSFRNGSAEIAAPAAEPGFGGVLEVTFSTEDAALQDALATECGLVARPLSGPAASPPPLLPGVRWYPKPTGVKVAISCLERREAVRRVSWPL